MAGSPVIRTNWRERSGWLSPRVGGRGEPTPRSPINNNACRRAPRKKIQADHDDDFSSSILKPMNPRPSHTNNTMCFFSNLSSSRIARINHVTMNGSARKRRVGGATATEYQQSTLLPVGRQLLAGGSSGRAVVEGERECYCRQGREGEISRSWVQ